MKVYSTIFEILRTLFFTEILQNSDGFGNNHLKIKIFDRNLSEIRNLETLEQRITMREVSKYGVFSGPYCPAFGLNAEG